MAAQDAVIEDEIEVVMLVAHRDALLASLEAEARAEFEQEGLKVVEQRLLQVGFQIVRFLGEPREFEHIGVADQIRDDLGNIGRLLSSGLDDSLLIGGQPGALVKQGADLALELALGPVALETFVFVESPLPGIVEPDQLQEMSPRQTEEHGHRQWRRQAFGGLAHHR